VLGFGAYTWLLRVTTPAAVGTYAFVNPVVALALALAVGDEPFSIRTIASGIMVLGAVLLIWKSSAGRPRLYRTAEPLIQISASSLRSLSRFRALV
jgi:drug/metabolite transporter (DMT)-like permease